MKPECSEFQKKMPGIFLGDLTEEERRSFESHLAVCPDCRSEHETYAGVVESFSSLRDMEVPRHFFVHPEEKLNPWQLFFRMAPGWKAFAAAFATLVFLIAFAALSRLQISAGPEGWSLAFGSASSPTKEEIIRIIEERSQRRDSTLIQNARFEIDRMRADLTKQQQAELARALSEINPTMIDLIRKGDAGVKDETQRLVLEICRIMAQQHARDLDAINLRLDSAETRNAIASRQTNEILDTLLEVADLGLR